MKSKIIWARFKGTNGSCGYSKNMEYMLIISKGLFGGIYIKQISGVGLCSYSNIVTFLNNWDDIKVLSNNQNKKQ